MRASDHRRGRNSPWFVCRGGRRSRQPDRVGDQGRDPASTSGIGDRSGGTAVDSRIASSDLSSVLKLTRALASDRRRESSHSSMRRGAPSALHRLRGELQAGQAIDRRPTRSRLRAERYGPHPALRSTSWSRRSPPRRRTAGTIIQRLRGGQSRGSPAGDRSSIFFTARRSSGHDPKRGSMPFETRYEDQSRSGIRPSHSPRKSDPAFQTLIARLPDRLSRDLADTVPAIRLGPTAPCGPVEAGLLCSTCSAWRGPPNRGFRSERDRRVGWSVDEVRESSRAPPPLLCEKHAGQAEDRGGRVYIVCCGTSFHAAKAACLFFSSAGVDRGLGSAARRVPRAVCRRFSATATCSWP